MPRTPYRSAGATPQTGAGSRVPVGAQGTASRGRGPRGRGNVPENYSPVTAANNTFFGLDTNTIITSIIIIAIIAFLVGVI